MSRERPNAGAGAARSQASVRRRLVVLVAVVTGSAVVALTLLVQALLAWTTRDSADTALAERAQSVAAATTVEQGRLVTPGSRLDSGVAVYDETGRLVAGSVPAALTADYTALAGVTEPRARMVRGDQRLYALPFSSQDLAGQSRSGVVVVVERLAPYEETEAVALLVSIVAGLLLVAVATAMAAWASRRALAPVSAMAATAEEWSERDLDRRFDLGPPRDEITSLGQTLDRLLEKVAGAIRAEQRLTAELAHELRTPLTVVRGAADLLVMSSDLSPDDRAEAEEIRASAARMADTVTSLLSLARQGGPGVDGGAREQPRADLDEVLYDCVAALGPAGDRVSVHVPDGLAAQVPADLLRRAVQPLLENAVRLATAVSVTAQPAGTRVQVRVEDDGPGVAEELRDRLFTPGASTRGTSGGLGLSLARRVARSIGGDTVLVSPADPTVFAVELPLAPPAPR